MVSENKVMEVPGSLWTKPVSCQVCRDLDEELLGIPSTATHEAKADLIDSSSRGCKFCVTILDGICMLFPGWRDSENKEGEPGSFRLSGGFQRPLAISLEFRSDKTVPTDSQGQSIVKMEFYSVLGDSVSCKAFGKAPHVPKPLPECRHLISAWMKKCLRDHPGCRSSQPPVLPTRVIDLDAGGDDWSYYTLFEPEGEQRAHYVCLSYRRGGPRAFKTTKATLPQMKQRISWGDLPFLFKNAVHTTRGLGFRYLWIDCLCIVQDNFDDWARESGNMARIYGEASLVLASATARSPEDGFYHLASPESGPFPIQFRQGEDSAPEIVNVRKALDHGENYRYPLMERAWTFQEAWLARRVVEFHYDEIFYKCPSATWCCCADSDHEPSSVPSSMAQPSIAGTSTVTDNTTAEFSKREVSKAVSSTDTSTSSAASNNEGTASSNEDTAACNEVIIPSNEGTAPTNYPPSAETGNTGLTSNQTPDNKAALAGATTIAKGFGLDPRGMALNIYSSWMDIVEQYNARRLTKDSDSLPALSGIARRFSNVIGAYYLAGLWGENLINGLCWFSDRRRRRRPSEPRGPSWSWVAIEGPVRFSRAISMQSMYETGRYSEAVVMGNLEKVEARVLSAGCETTTSDPTGAIGDSFVEMSGFLVVGTHRYREGTGKHTPYLCCRWGEESVEGSTMEAFYPDFRASDPEPEQIPQDGDALFLLKIGLVGWPPEPPTKFRALVLKRARSCPACFERVGFIESSDHDEIDWFKNAERCTVRIT